MNYAMFHAELLLLSGLPFCAPAKPDLASFGNQHAIVLLLCVPD